MQDIPRCIIIYKILYRYGPTTAVCECMCALYPVSIIVIKILWLLLLLLLLLLLFTYIWSGGLRGHEPETYRVLLIGDGGGGVVLRKLRPISICTLNRRRAHDITYISTFTILLYYIVYLCLYIFMYRVIHKQ